MNKLVGTRPDTEHRLGERQKTRETFILSVTPTMPVHGRNGCSFSLYLGQLRLASFPPETEVSNDIIRILQESQVRHLETDRPRIKYQRSLAHSLTQSKSLNSMMFRFHVRRTGTIMAPTCQKWEHQPGCWLGLSWALDTGECSFPSAKHTLTPTQAQWLQLLCASILLWRWCPECLNHFTCHPGRCRESPPDKEASPLLLDHGSAGQQDTFQKLRPSPGTAQDFMSPWSHSEATNVSPVQTVRSWRAQAHLPSSESSSQYIWYVSGTQNSMRGTK